MRANFAKALSGFGNTEGGVILWGVSTTKHQHSGLDVLSQLEPIGKVVLLEKHINNHAFTLITPSLAGVESKVFCENKSDTRGIIATFIPKTLGDPIRSNEDDHYYFRTGDEFKKAPYELIKRLFASTDQPDLIIMFDSRLNKLESDNNWNIPFLIVNRSNAVAENIKMSITILNPEAYEEIKFKNFKDTSEINPGKNMYMFNVPDVVHRGLNSIVDKLDVKMKARKRTLKLCVSLYANRMRAKDVYFTLTLSKDKISISNVREEFQY